MKIRALTATLTLALLTACGGSGGSDSPNVDSSNHNPRPVSGDMGKRYVMPFDDWEDGSSELFESKRNGTTFVTSRMNQGYTVDSGVLPAGFAEFPAQMHLVVPGGRELTHTQTMRSYKGFHAGVFTTAPYANDVDKDWSTHALYLNYLDPSKQLPSSGKATYTGRAFNYDAANDANLRYTINFGTRRGSGEISASRNLGRITLQDAPIRQKTDDEFGNLNAYGVYGGTASIEDVSGRHVGIDTYTLGIAGPNAEEIVGNVNYDATTPQGQKSYPEEKILHFHGTRGDITP